MIEDILKNFTTISHNCSGGYVCLANTFYIGRQSFTSVLVRGGLAGVSDGHGGQGGGEHAVSHVV